jgi:hypothetical protein
MSLAQYASPYNNDDSEETSNINTNIRMTQSQNQNQNRGRGGAAEKKMPLRKTIKRPLAQQEKQQQGSESRVANFMSKLSAVKNTNHVQVGGDDGTSGIDESENDLADYQPMNDEGEKINKDDDGVVTRENFENLPSTYASQYYQQYVPLSYNQQQQQNNVESNALPGSRDDLMQKMNHIIQMLEDQQDEKTGSVTEELIFVVDSFVRAGKYVR